MPQRSPVFEIITQGFDPGDPYGSAADMAWAVAGVAQAFGNPEPSQTLEIEWGLDRPTEDRYREKANSAWYAQGEDDGITDLSHITVDLFIAVDNGEIEPDSLNFAARVVKRYLGLVEAAGRAY